MSNIKYRADIDGLRSLAVSSVIVYHLGLATFSGGYVGVDIFFVISGYLIGKILINNITSGKFTFSDFYLRRAKRLFPAFFSVVGATLLLGYFIMLPWDYQQLAQSSLASSVYLSNIHFFGESGYFDTSSKLKPLLHTWSLAVEEQFYLFFPLVLLLIIRFLKKSWQWLVVGLGVCSFIAAVLMINSNQPAVFFLFPFRAWELLAGVIVAAGIIPHVKNPWVKESLGFLSLMLMVLPIFLYNHDTIFPGYAAIPPTIGAALYIYLGENARALSVVNKMFSAKFFVLIGLASYSLYLWHWPIIVFARYVFWFDESALTTAITAIALTVIGFLSWRFIEIPSRGWLDNVRPLNVAGYSILISLLLVGVSYFFHSSKGYPERLPVKVVTLANAGKDFSHDWSRCYHKEQPSLTPGMSGCLMGDKKLGNVSINEISTVIWGDSHARAMMPAINRAAEKLGISALLIWEAGCPPAFDVIKDELKVSAAGDQQCMDRNEAMKSFFSAPENQGIKKVILISRWSYYFYGGGIGLDEDVKISVKFKNSPEKIPGDQENVIKNALLQTIGWLVAAGKDVVVYEQVPEFPDFQPREIAIKTLIGSNQISSRREIVTEVDLDQRQGAINAFFDHLNRQGKITFIPTHQVFCQQGQCSALKESIPQFIDNNHITVSASKKLDFLFVSQLRQ